MKNMYLWKKKDTINWINNHEIFNIVRNNNKDINNLFLYLLEKKDNLRFKEGERNEEYMYWYPSLNSYIPLTSKRDRIHQSIYVFHDLIHLILIDPLPSVDKNTYIKMKMLGEIFSFYISEFKYVKTLKKNVKWHYDLKYTNCKFNTKNEETILRALYYNFILKDSSLLLNILKKKKYYELFNGAYENMFNQDIKWNNLIYTQYEQNETKKNWHNKILFYKKFLSNEHYYDNKELKDDEIFDICYAHYNNILNCGITIKGNGFKLGEKIGQYNNKYYNMLYINKKIKY